MFLWLLVFVAKPQWAKRLKFSPSTEICPRHSKSNISAVSISEIMHNSSERGKQISAKSVMELLLCEWGQKPWGRTPGAGRERQRGRSPLREASVFWLPTCPCHRTAPKGSLAWHEGGMEPRFGVTVERAHSSSSGDTLAGSAIEGNNNCLIDLELFLMRKES